MYAVVNHHLSSQDPGWVTTRVRCDESLPHIKTNRSNHDPTYTNQMAHVDEGKIYV